MKINHKNMILAVTLMLLSFSTFAQVETVFNGTTFNESIKTVQEKLNTISETSKIIRIENPSFPLAKHKEEHLICTNIKTKNGIIAKAAFSFSDDKLSFIEARGNAIKSLIETRKDTAMTYLGFKVYRSDMLFADLKNDIVKFLTKEAAHPNLFMWSNPYLISNDDSNPRYNSSAIIPDFLKMGADMDELKPLIEANSTLTQTEELDGSDPNAQVQINAFGVEYAGFPRKIEARFGDNKLNAVWILTGKGEEDRIRQKLIAAYGEPIFKTDDWEIFNNWQIGLRKDKPEVLLLTQKIGLQYKKDFFKQ